MKSLISLIGSLFVSKGNKRNVVAVSAVVVAGAIEAAKYFPGVAVYAEALAQLNGVIAAVAVGHAAKSGTLTIK